LIALARKLLTIIYAVLKNGTEYREEEIAMRQSLQMERRKKALIRELAKLGVNVSA